MAAKSSTITCFSISLEENSHHGRHPFHWCFLVQTSCERRSSGELVSLLLSYSHIFLFYFKCFSIATSYVCIIWQLLQVTLFTRGKAPITQQLPDESDADYADFKSQVRGLICMTKIAETLNWLHFLYLWMSRSCTWRETEKTTISWKAVSLLRVMMLYMT